MPTELPQQENANVPDDPAPGRDDRTPGYDPQRPPKAAPTHDAGSMGLGTIAGIPIRLHVTFLILLSWLFMEGAGAKQGWSWPLSIAALFFCILLHELGHALVGMRYGVRTRNITLYPIGGIASMELPPRPRQELWIALAGPAVNLGIAGLLFLGLRLTGQPLVTAQTSSSANQFVANLMWGNLFIGGFNLLPAFPMDGGRILRAIAARFTDDVTATMIAARIGKFAAMLFGLFGLYTGQFMLIIIAAFVYFGAGQEAAGFQAHALTAGHRVREAMLREFKTLPVGCTLQEAADALIAGSQQDFPIVNGGEVVGLLSRAALLRGFATEGPGGYVAGTMERDFPNARPDDDLETVLASTQQAGPLLVMEPDAHGVPKLVGMLTQENLFEFLTLTRLRQRTGQSG